MQKRFSALSLPPSRRRARLIRDLRTLARDAERLIETAGEEVSDRASSARDRLTRVVERVRDTCDDLQERTVESARAAAQHTDRVVRARPYESLGVAFGVGVLVGLLLRRD